MSAERSRVMTYMAFTGAVIAAVLAIVMFTIGQPIPGSGLAVIAIAALGTVGYSGRSDKAQGN